MAAAFLLAPGHFEFKLVLGSVCEQPVRRAVVVLARIGSKQADKRPVALMGQITPASEPGQQNVPKVYHERQDCGKCGASKYRLATLRGLHLS